MVEITESRGKKMENVFEKNEQLEQEEIITVPLFDEEEVKQETRLFGHFVKISDETCNEEDSVDIEKLKKENDELKEQNEYLIKRNKECYDYEMRVWELEEIIKRLKKDVELEKDRADHFQEEWDLVNFIRQELKTKLKTSHYKKLAKEKERLAEELLTLQSEKEAIKAENEYWQKGTDYWSKRYFDIEKEKKELEAKLQELEDKEKQKDIMTEANFFDKEEIVTKLYDKEGLVIVPDNIPSDEGEVELIDYKALREAVRTTVTEQDEQEQQHAHVQVLEEKIKKSSMKPILKKIMIFLFLLIAAWIMMSNGGNSPQNQKNMIHVIEEKK